jgi:Na+/H+ antiporter NhaD/arsenite permease-like protein
MTALHNVQRTFIDFILREWLLSVAAVSLLLTSLYTGRLPVYSMDELEVLFILFFLFIAVNGLQQSGLIVKMAGYMEKGRLLPVKLVVTTFFLSMLVTNDIALIVMVPLTLSLNINRKDILVILEALAANAGSALTPIGNPQNLFIYWFYSIHPFEFVKTVLPFSISFLLILPLISFFAADKNDQEKLQEPVLAGGFARIYAGLLFLVLLTVLHLLPVWIGVFTFIFAFFFDRQALRIDYALLFSFFFFFGLAENLKTLLASEISHSGHIFLFSALASQVMSNVPATLLFAKFTSNWKALLWGVNAGGFGSLFGSLANLIAYKIYVTHEDSHDITMFTVKFLVMGYSALFLSAGLYYLLL